jgi:RND family efflux transporter MFP subunit
MNFFKSKKFLIIAAVVIVLVALLGYRSYKNANAPISYETVKVERGTIKQTVEATGKIQSADDLSLRFEISGTVETVNVKEGDKVKAGDILMKLKTADLNASVAQASANLNQKLAGATKEDISYYRSAVDLAKASLDQAKADGDHSIAAAELAVDTAKNNLKLVEGGDNSEIVNNAYENAVTVLQSSLSTMDNSLTQADNILGIDNNLANDDIESYLSILDSSKLILANSSYDDAKLSVSSARSAINILNTASAHPAIDDGLNLAVTALGKCISLLAAVKDTLTATSPVGDLTQAILDAKKTTIETARTSAITQYNTAISRRQEVETAKNSYTTYSIAYDKAVKDLANVRDTAASAVAIKEASYRQAQANYDAKINPPREVDVAYLRAALSQALATRDKATLRAPIDGVVTKIFKKKGEFTSMSEAAAEMLSPHYEIEVDIPESDVVKLKLQDSVSTTLDAYGDDVVFTGKVIAIDPASTEVQDVVYYRVKVTLDDTSRDIKSGMTANVTVGTATRENVLYIPGRAVRTNNGSGKFVKILEAGQPKDMPVKLGLRADDGFVEITEGLNGGEEVIISVVENK